MKHPCAIHMLLLSCVLATVAFAQSAAPDVRGVDDLANRLEALDGTNALAYFELAEEVAYEEQGKRALPIARQLYVLAYEVDRTSSPPMNLGPSVCLALADLAESHVDRRWLLMLADAMRGMSSRTGQSVDTQLRADAAHTARLIEAMSHARAGRFRDLRDELVRIGINTSRAAGERLRGGGALRAGGEWAKRRLRLAGLESRAADEVAEGLVTAAGTVPCPTCKGRRTVDRHDHEDGAVIGIDLCPTCRGMPASLTINEATDTLLLRAQALLLDAQPATWNAQHLIDPAGVPMRDLDPDELAPAFGVDADARFWQPLGLAPLEGTWSGEE